MFRRQSWTDLPEGVRVLLAKAREMARLCGAASAPEEIEFIALNFIQSCDEAQSEWRARCTTPEAKFRLTCLTRDGFRCAICGTSRTLQIHHVYPRSECHAAGREDLMTDPANGVTLCAAHHAVVQPVWADYVDALLAHIKAPA